MGTRRGGAVAGGAKPMTQAIVAIGANLDDPLAHARRALAELAALPGVACIRRSRLYRTPPMGPPGQADYINAVAVLETEHPALDLLDHLQGLETAHGRVRTGERWGPRTLDLDLLLYGDAVIQNERLTVPHAGIAERGFFLLPLAEAAPGVHIPGHGRVETLLAQVDLSGIEAVESFP